MSCLTVTIPTNEEADEIGDIFRLAYPLQWSGFDSRVYDRFGFQCRGAGVTLVEGRHVGGDYIKGLLR